MDLTGLIDADTHVDETDATWEYMGPGGISSSQSRRCDLTPIRAPNTQS